MFLKLVLHCFASLLVVVSSFALPFEGLYKLNIVHYNDFHARFEETSVITPTCHFNNNSCLGGFPRLYTEIQTLLKEKPDAILLNAGDSFQGTYWYTLLKWNVTQEFMNLLPHDAHALGNHEFDDGPEGLAPYIKALKAPVLAANMETTDGSLLRGLYKSHIVTERNGRKIGIIGLITPETKTLSSPGDKVAFLDPGEVTKRELAILTAKGVDIIILLSHCGLDVDKQLARDYGADIDVIIGGHTHSLLWNGPAPSGENVAGPYPVFVQPTDDARHNAPVRFHINPNDTVIDIKVKIGGNQQSLSREGEDGAGHFSIVVQPTADEKHNVLIVQASAFTKYMGNLSVYFDYKGDYAKWDGGPIYLDRSIPEDEDVKAKLQPYAQLVHQAENIPLGQTMVTLDADDCVFGECALGDLIVDALNEFAKSSVNSEYNYIAFIQRGNIKSSIPEGNITAGMIFELLPYNDRVVSFEIQGEQVRAALERSVSDAWSEHPFKGPWVLQVAGLSVKYDVSKLEGSRIDSVTVSGADNSAPLADNQYYLVTAPSYLADGGDGFTMFKTGRRNERVISRDHHVVETYIKKHSPLRTQTDGRIVIEQ